MPDNIPILCNASLTVLLIMRLFHLCLGSTQWFNQFAAPVFQQCCMKVELSAQSYVKIINL